MNHKQDYIHSINGLTMDKTAKGKGIGVCFKVQGHMTNCSRNWKYITWKMITKKMSWFIMQTRNLAFLSMMRYCNIVIWVCLNGNVHIMQAKPYHIIIITSFIYFDIKVFLQLIWIKINLFLWCSCRQSIMDTVLWTAAACVISVWISATTLPPVHAVGCMNKYQ